MRSLRKADNHVSPASQQPLRLERVGHLLLAGIVAGILLLAGAVTASAGHIESKRREAQAILAQVEQLDADLGDAAERWNGANYRLMQISDRLKTTRSDLVRGRRQVKVSRALVAARLVQLYTQQEPPSALEIVLGAHSLEEAIDGVDAASRIGAQDARLAEDFQNYRNTVAQRERELANARAAQADTVRRRAAERDAIEAKLGERKRLLASVQEEVRRLEEQERRRQAELRRRAIAELERQRREAAEQRRAAAEQRRAAAQAPTPAQVEAPPRTEQAVSNPDDSTVAPPPPPQPVAAPSDASGGAQVVAIAMRYLGIPYLWGGASPSSGFDCSGLTMYVFAQVGISLPHYAAAQYGMGIAVSKDQLAPGDLVFFRGLGHMGMYIGGGSFIHAPHTGDVVKISSLSDSYYVANWVGARRVL